MAEGSGMVAVVRARRDAGLAVTLLDGGRQYTLMPDEEKPSAPPQVHITPRVASPAGLPTRMHLPGCQTHHNQSSMTSAPNPQARQQRDSETVEPPRCDSGAQATDGRYASMYKMAHCSLNPTSPPVQLTEFPPQRASLCPGHGNFEVGGSGSGENYVPCRSPGSFRGGLSWPDRGSVCSPRSSRQPDAFANSLRKYPNMSLERSTEMIERLITYTQAKNLSKTHPNRCQSPSRHGIESNASNPIVPDRSVSRNTVTRPCSYQNSYEPEVKIRIRQEDSPTRDARELRGGDCECAEYRRVVKTADRCVNMTKKMKENGRSYSYTLPFQQCASPGIRDRYEHNYSISGQHTPSLLTATNSVNMEVQAAAEMVSREVATVPRAEPVKRTVAVPLSRTSSSDDQKREVSSLVTNNFTVQLCGNIQTFDRDCAGRHPKSPANIKAVQTSVSSVDLTKQECSFCRRKIKSQEDLRNRHRDVLLQNEVLEWLKETYATNPSSRLWGEKMQRLAQKLKRPGGEERIRQKIQRYLKRVPSQFSECDEDRREFREQLPDNIIRKLKKMYLKPDKKRCYNSSPVRILRIEVPKHENDSTRNIDTLICSIDDWLKEIPMKKIDFLGRSIRKGDVLNSVVNKVEPYILNRHNFDKDYKHTLKTIVLNILNEMPIEIDDNDKSTFLKRLALSLVSDILNIDNNDRDVELLQNVNVSGKEREIKAFVMNEVATVMTKLHLSISTKRLALLEEELKHTFVDANTTSNSNDDSVMKDNVFIILHNLGGLSSYQANYFTDIMVKHFKEEYCVNKDYTSPNHDDTCKPSLTGVTLNETYSVFHNVSKTKSTVSTRSLKSTSNGNKKGDVSNFKQQIIEQIDDWLKSLQLQIPVKKKVLNKAMRDLAEDVLDRLKYLELNPTCKGSEEDETQYLKYQIFKWFNKVAGEQITKTIEHALELMNRIQTVNAAVLSKSQENNINQPSSTCNYGSLNKTCDQKVTISKHSRRKWQSPTNKDSCKWMDNKLNPTITDEKIRNTLSLKSIKIDSKLEKICTRNYEDIIDDWIDTIFCEKFGEPLDYENRNEHIREFAIKIYDSLNKSKSSERKTQIERMAYEWLQKLPFRLFSDQASFEKDCITKLVDYLLSIKPTEGNDIINDQIGSVTENNMNSTGNYAGDLIVETPDEHVNDIEEKGSRASNVTVYGCTLPSTSREGVKSNNQDVRIGYNEDDIEANTEMYLKQLVENIDEWLRSLQIPQIHDKGFREIVVNDLAADIIDRKKYLELNPSSRGTDENELEQLKYQIFKWINKLVGENQKETVERASELMDRIQSIPVPTLVKQSERDCKSACPQMQNRRSSKSSPSTPNVSGYKSPANKRKLSPNANLNTAKSCLGEGAIAKSKTPQSPSGVKLSSPLGFTTGPMANSNQNINQMSSGSSKRPDKKNVGSTNVNKNDNSQNLACPELCDNSEESEGLPLGMTIEEVYQHYDNIIKQRVQEIPLETPTSEQAMLADLARKGLYNGIWKAYFQLKANPDVENDYSYFEMLFEEHIDDILDCLPQTEEMQKTRPGWKSKLLMDVMNMLKYIHSITDTPSFRQKIAEKFDRQFVKAQYQESSNLHQHGFVVRTAEAYILYSNYREDDPIKANIYKQRLMKRIEELANAVKSDNNVDFRYINQAQLCQIAMQMLETVPVPQGEALKDEANEILIGEEIENWYNALPVMPIRNETDEILRKRMRELLAKRLCEIEKGFDIDDSAAETNMKHEVSQFLHEKAVLQPNEDLNIDFMVEELTNRLKTRKQQGQLEYESFVKEAPVSSTFVQTDPGEVLAPLVDIGDDINNNGSMLQNAPDKSNRGENPLFTSQCGRQSIPGPIQAIDTRANNQGNGGRISITSGLGNTSFVRSCCQPQPRLSGAIDRSLVPNGAPQDGQQYSYADGNRRSSTREDRQAFGQRHLSGHLQPSYVSRDPSPTGATGSTARLATVNPEEQFEEGEVRYKCRCLERVWRCKRRRVCEEGDRYPRCFPMPFPCRHFY